VIHFEFVNEMFDCIWNLFSIFTTALTTCQSNISHCEPHHRIQFMSRHTVFVCLSFFLLRLANSQCQLNVAFRLSCGLSRAKTFIWQCRNGNEAAAIQPIQPTGQFTQSQGCTACARMSCQSKLIAELCQGPVPVFLRLRLKKVVWLPTDFSRCAN